MRWLPMIALATASCAAGNGGSQDARVLTSTAAADCRAPPRAIVERYDEQGLAVEVCEAPAAVALYIVSSDARSWLDIGDTAGLWSAPGTIWTTEDAVVYRHPIGLFPNVAGSQAVAWRVDGEGRPLALTFEVVGQDPEGTQAQVTRLFVVLLDTHGACLAGRATTNEAARALERSECSEQLEQRN